MKQRLVLHVGPLKTGTTYLQAGFQQRRDTLAEHGWLYPGSVLNQEKAFFGLIGGAIPWVSPELQAEKAAQGEALISQVNGWDGPVLVSAEALCSVLDEDVKRVTDFFPDRPVRVVVTGRDLGRLLPSHVTQLYKTGNAEGLTPFLQRVTDQRPGREGEFWRMHDLPALVARWHALDVVDEVVLVTLPRSGGSPDALWARFVEAAGWTEPGLVAAPEVPPSEANLALTGPETRLVRTLNLEMRRQGRDPQYARRIISTILHEGLAKRDPSQRGERVLVPASWRETLEGWAEEDIAALRGMDLRVVGDLDDLRPQSIAKEDVDASAVTPQEQDSLQAAAVALIAAHDDALKAYSRPVRNVIVKQSASSLTTRVKKLVRRR